MLAGGPGGVGGPSSASAITQTLRWLNPPPGVVGSEEHVRELVGARVELHTLERQTLEVTAFAHPHEFAEHFKARYGPTIVAQGNARRNGRETEFEETLDRFCDEWNRCSATSARFEMEYLIAVGTRA